jgi:hypothetical protein
MNHYDWIKPQRPRVCDEGIAHIIDDARYGSQLIYAVATELERIAKSAAAAGSLSEVDEESLNSDIPQKLARVRDLLARQISDLTKLAEAELSRRVSQSTRFQGELS